MIIRTKISSLEKYKLLCKQVLSLTEIRLILECSDAHALEVKNAAEDLVLAKNMILDKNRKTYTSALTELTGYEAYIFRHDPEVDVFLRNPK